MPTRAISSASSLIPVKPAEADEDLRNQLLTAYFALDAFSVDGDALKN